MLRPVPEPRSPVQHRPVSILAPAVYVSITIEATADGDDVHIHAGGQGMWVARMLAQLGHCVAICAPVGGEIGHTLLGLVGRWGIDVHPVETLAGTPAYVHDRRSGERVELARSPLPTLRRHEADDLYDLFLELALSTSRCVVTGPEDERTFPRELYRRLGADLAAAGVPVVADLHGPSLDAFLEGGPIAVLKVSTTDLVENGRLDKADRDDDAVVDEVIDDLVARGAATVLVSRGKRPILAAAPDGRFAVTGPVLDAVDKKGAGDSMTAAVTSALADGADTRTLLARAWAAGAANVTRRGLGSANAGLIAQLAERAEVRER
jgi:1-phosphofructokinase